MPLQSQPGPVMEILKKGQNFHELLQSDLLIRDLSSRAAPNWKCAYYCNATKHREEAEVESTHVTAKVLYLVLEGTRMIYEAGIPERKLQARRFQNC